MEAEKKKVEAKLQSENEDLKREIANLRRNLNWIKKLNEKWQIDWNKIWNDKTLSSWQLNSNKDQRVARENI